MDKRPPLSAFLQKQKEEASDDAVIAKLKGAKGDKGDTGSPGKDGADGKDGLDGKDGKDGAKGPKGDRGEQGFRGEKGDNGEGIEVEELEALVLSLLPDNVEIPEVTPKELIEKINKAKTAKIKRERVEGFDEVESIARSANKNVQNFLSLGGSRQTAIKVSGTLLGTGITTLNFVGATGTVVGDGSEANVTTSGSGGAGTVTSVSIATANGLAGSSDGNPATPTITLSTTITGVLKGNGTAISAASAGTDYQAPITLTTTGTSGAATFIANTLNIPNYSSGSGGITRSIASVATNTAAGSTAATDYVYLASGTITVTLPTTSGNTNLYTIKNIGAGVVTVATTGGETIDGSASASIPVQFTSYDFVATGGNWNVV